MLKFSAVLSVIACLSLHVDAGNLGKFKQSASSYGGYFHVTGHNHDTDDVVPKKYQKPSNEASTSHQWDSNQQQGKNYFLSLVIWIVRLEDLIYL